MTADVLIVGAGPAGAVAATVLARAGARVLLVDRARFPRDKLCGDTLNPGAMAILRRLGLAAAAETTGLRIDGMRVTGEGGVSVEGMYPQGLHGRAIARREFDAALVESAVAAGVTFNDAVAVQAPLVEHTPRAVVVGVSAAVAGRRQELRAPVTIAADGRHSTLAFALGLARHPDAPRRWAIGMHFANVRGIGPFGEMHIRRRHYIGLAPLPNGLANVCVVKPAAAVDRALGDPGAVLLAELAVDAELRERVARSQPVGRPHVLGPLAVDAVAGACPPQGLLLAGDACGFVDPMTGDGLRFALRGGEMAARAALAALQHGWEGVHQELDRQRRREFAAKWRFNRVLRALVGSPGAVLAAAAGARVAPAIVRALIAKASDCDIGAVE